MKKIIALVVALVMMAAMAVPAFAAEFTDDVVNNAGGTTITYGATQAYTVTVPANFTLAANTDTTATLSVSNYMISATKVLKISVDSENKDTVKNTWQLVEVLQEGASELTGAANVPYTIKVGGESIVPNSAVVLTLKTANGQNGADGEQVDSILTFNTAGTSQVAKFQDTITFSVAITDIQ